MPTLRFRTLILAAALVPLGRGESTRSAADPATLAVAGDPNPPLACTKFRRIRPQVVALGHPTALSGASGGRHTPVSPTPTSPPASPATLVTPGDIIPVPGGAVAVEPPTPRVVVRSPAELVDTLNSSFTGIIVVPQDVSWDLSDHTGLPLRSGVSLVGERGMLCNRPTLFDDNHEAPALFELSANNVRVEGIHFRGPAAGNRSAEQPYVHAIRVKVDRAQALGRGILISDNEFNEWPGAGVTIKSMMSRRTPAEYDPAWPRPTRADADQVRVERNFMHHNARDGGGYGVTVDGGAYASVMGNVFDFNRHAVASDGYAHTGYIARFNYVLQGGFMQGNFWNQHFDVHGTNDSDGNDVSTGYGGSAGEYYEIAFNTIRGKQTYYQGLKTRPSFMLRGKPTEGARFDANVDVHDDLDAAVSLKSDKGDTGWGEDQGKFNFSATGNSFGADYSGELAAGDFDGDGRTDAFLATGTAWFVSRAAVEPWQLLHGSTKRTAELAFADIDNDGVTDVIWRAPDGALGYLKSGAGVVIPLTTSPVPVTELRFGDFDGDGKTDVFRREPNGQWVIWFGRTRAWTAVESSGFPLSDLRFGEFDQTPGTDVVVVLRDQWAVSSGANAKWARLNSRLRPSFNHAVVADFDGDGRSDIAFDNGEQFWVFSSGGRGPLQSLRDADGLTSFATLDHLLVGHFDGRPSAGIVTYGDPYRSAPGDVTDRFVIWHRERGRDPFAQVSREAMR
jgi:hypothetical protein